LSGVNSLATELDTALKSLQLRWENTLTLWNDSVSQNFESQYLNPIEREVQTVLHEMDHLAKFIADARRQINNSNGN
jgi:hypothetical protein